MSVNKAILVGRLGGDPEIRYTQSGTAVCNFRLATDTRVKQGDQWENRTEWHRVVAFGRTAEVCGEYLNKGSQIYVEGRIQTREWEDKEGNRRWTTEIVCERMQMLGSRGDGGAQPGGGNRGGGNRGGGQQGPGDPFDQTPDSISDEDVPF